MASSAELALLAKARRRRAEAEAAAAAPAAVTPEPAPAQPSLVDAIMGGAQQLGLGVNRGIVNIAGMPGDIANAVPQGANPLTDALKMAPTGQQLQQFFKLDQNQPEGLGETLASRIGEEIGANAIPGLGITRKAVTMGLPAVREAGGFLRYLLEPAAVDPAAYLGKEAAYSTAAGTGAGLVDSIPGVDRNTPLGAAADTTGAVAGVGALGMTGALSKGLFNIVQALRGAPGYTDDAVKSAVVDRLAQAAGVPGVDGSKPYDVDPLIQQIMDATPNKPRVGDVIPGYEESLADRTGNPGIAALEYSRQTGPNAGEFARQRGSNSELVDAAMRNAAPREQPGTFRSALDEERTNRLNAASTASDTANTEFEDYVQSLSPTMTAEPRGQTVRAGVQHAERMARDTEGEMWRAIHGEVDPAPLAERMNDVQDNLTLQRQQSTADLGPTTSIPERLSTDAEGNPAGPVDLAELNDMRSELTRVQREALTAGDRNRAEVAGQYLDELNAYLDSEAVPPAVRQQTQDARAVSRDVNERFNRPNDPLAKTLSMSEGRPDLPDSRVAPEFVQPDSGQASNIDRLLAETDLTSHGRTVRSALKDELLAQMEKARVIGDPDRTTAFLKNHTRVFERFPDLRAEVEQASLSGQRALDTQAAEVDLQTSLGTPEKPGKGTVGKYLTYSDANSEKAISDVLSSKDPGAAADELMTFIGDNPKAAEGARAAFWQKLKSESTSVDNANRTMGGKYQWRGDWLKRFLDDPRTKAVFDRLYRDDPTGKQTIEQIAAVLDNVDLRQRGRAPGTSGTAQGVNPVLTPETLQSRVYAFLRGQVSGGFLVTSILAVVARRAVRNAQTAAIERLTDQALLHPDEAAVMLKDFNPANVAALRRRAKLWLGNQASTVLQMLDGTDEADDKPEQPEIKAGGV